MKLENPVAIGNTAEVYDYQPGWILKLFKDRFSRGDVEYEFRINQAVEKAGIPVPQTGDDLIEIEGRFGILYEKIEGQPMARALEKQPWKLFAYARKMAEMHVQMHANPVKAEGIPFTHERLASKINRASGPSQEIQAAALTALKSMPAGDRLCHGDFHFENILVDDGHFIIIDWVDATLGSPLADVARTSVILLGEIATQKSRFVRNLLRIIHAVYVRRYFSLRPDGKDEYHRWMPIIAAGRLSEGLDYQKDWLTEQAKGVLE